MTPKQFTKALDIHVNERNELFKLNRLNTFILLKAQGVKKIHKPEDLYKFNEELNQKIVEYTKEERERYFSEDAFKEMDIKLAKLFGNSSLN